MVESLSKYTCVKGMFSVGTNSWISWASRSAPHGLSLGTDIFFSGATRVLDTNREVVQMSEVALM